MRLGQARGSGMGQTNVANSSVLRRAIEQARKELVDPTRRNRLLHAPLSGKRPWCLAVSGFAADDLFANLCRREGFKGFAFAPKLTGGDSQTSTDPESPVAGLTTTPSRNRAASQKMQSGRPQLQTSLDAEKLEKRLTKIFREERTLEEEQGISTLYLAVGFLKWFEDDHSEEASFAPLVLVPVSLIRARGKEGFLLTGRDDEIVINVSLLEKLRNDFNVSLPPIPEGDAWRPSDYFDAIEREINRYRRWEVERESVGLGFFTFSKFMMWRDLDASTWPNGALLDNALLDVLIGNGGEFETAAPLVPDEESIDAIIDLSKTIHVVDADSSQAIVIQEAASGRNLVVQGPPGTGKSQTITNIIAAAVYEGKTVLFVAEKAAALSVVQDRLGRAGLGALCLSMHSKKANKREVLGALDEALRFPATQRVDEEAAKGFADCRDKLNGWSHTLHKPINRTGRTPYEVIGVQLKLQADKVKLLPIQLEHVSEWSKEQIRLGLAALDNACDAVTKLGCVPTKHVWFGTELETLSPFDTERLKTTLDDAIESLDALVTHVTSIYEKIVGTGKPTLASATGLTKSFRHLAIAPGGRNALQSDLWHAQLEALIKAIDQGEHVSKVAREIDTNFRREAWSFDTTASLVALRADGGSFFRRLGKRYRQANADFRAIYKAELPKDFQQRVKMLEKLRDAQAAHHDFRRVREALTSALGPLWNELDTDWSSARQVADWLTKAQKLTGSQQIIALASKSADVGLFAPYADALDQVTQTALRCLDRVRESVKPARNHFADDYFDNLPLTELRTAIAQWREKLDAANDWVSARGSLERLRNEGLRALAEGLVQGRLHAAELRAEAELLIAEALWKRAVQDDPGLATIDGLVRSERVDDFCNFDRRRIRSARSEVLSRYVAQRPNGYVGEMGIVRGEIEKKRGHRALRKLMTDAGAAVQRLKPVFLMSPLSVAQFIPPGKIAFDLLVIDEASQIAPEDALGVVARAKQIVVVGDHKQLPPTNFFKMVNAGADDEDEENEGVAPEVSRPSDYESILTLARTRGMSERMLAWHYRSKHPSLIALSNDECYGGRLLLPPSPFVQTEQFGLALVKTPRGHYDRGGTSRDLVQAEEVARAVHQHILQHPNKSLGVACLSVQQREAVYDMIDKLGIRGDVEAFAPNDERLFVKNLEAVQGDERDVIFISIGYGVAPNQSRPFQNFGPVSRDGGERRLNVLASRAREKCVVFSSITAADIPADAAVRGTRMLRSLLHFAETGKLGAGSFQGGDFDSPFEEAVARTIREAGFHVHSQVGVSSFRIDLGVINPARPGEYLVGVECDGATYHSARSARDRDRIRQEVLEGLGWRLHRIWSTDWFRNPLRETDKLLAAIRTADQARTDLEVTKSDLNDDVHPADQTNLIPFPSPSEEAVEDLTEIDLTREHHYRECILSVPVRRGILEIPVAELGRYSLKVIEAEGPVHTEEVARRLREAFGLQKTGARILNHVQNSLKHLNQNGLAIREGDFWMTESAETIQVRSRRKASLPLRRATMIAPREYQSAIDEVIQEAVSISTEDLAVETARRFGFDRTGQDLRQEIARQVKALLDSGKIVREGDILRSVGDGR